MRRIAGLLRYSFLLASLLWAPLLRAAETDVEQAVKQGLKTITAKGGRTHLLVLAGTRCEGRASGEKGSDVAADYLEQVFRDLGLKPGAGGESYRQPFQVRAGPFPGQRPKTVREVRMSPTSNLIAVLEGSDPELAREYVILGAHYDHIGFLDLRKRKVFWGADDNASGTAAVLLVAEAFAKGTLRPKRTLVFILFSGEERGLLGSKHYVNQPAFPLADTVAMINLDMVGRNEPARLDVYGSQSSEELDRENMRLERASRFRFSKEGGSVFMRSDHYPFYERGIPVLFLSTGLHGDLHDLDDEPRKINWSKLERAAEHSFRLLWAVGNLAERPTYKKLPPSGAAGILGFIPATLSKTEIKNLGLGRKRGAVGVSRVLRDSPAAASGMQGGDLVLGLAGRYLKDRDPLKDLDDIADGLERGGRYPLLLLRDGRTQKVPVTLR